MLYSSIEAFEAIVTFKRQWVKLVGMTDVRLYLFDCDYQGVPQSTLIFYLPFYIRFIAFDLHSSHNKTMVPQLEKNDLSSTIL